MNRLGHLVKSLLKSSDRTNTVRFMFPATITFVAFLSAALITSTDVSYIRLESSDATIETGKQFSIDVYAFAHVPVNTVDITLQFDPTAVEVLSVDKGQSVLTIWAEEPQIKDGKVTLKGGTFKKGFLKDHKIATINLEAKQTGQSNLKATDVMFLAGDGKGSQVAVAESVNSTLSLYIYDENTNPENIDVNVEVKIITDIDGDGKVTLKDISAFMSAWHTNTTKYDFNGDGRMTFLDFSIILANYIF